MFESQENTSLKNILMTAFWKQNAWHRHGVIVHSLRVTWEIIKDKNYKMIPAGLLHDIGKPFVAYQKPKDITRGEYSFTDHEEASYQMIKNWSFISDYTKELVRYHYLLRDMELGFIKNNGRFEPKAKIYSTLSKEFKKDLKQFIVYDDLGKGVDADAIKKAKGLSLKTY